MMVDHAGRLHERVTDGRSDELETALEQVPAHRVRFRRARRRLGYFSPAVLDRFAADETPKLSVEAPEFFVHGEECFRIRDRGRDLQPVADDAGIGE